MADREEYTNIFDPLRQSFAPWLEVGTVLCYVNNHDLSSYTNLIRLLTADWNLNEMVRLLDVIGNSLNGVEKWGC